MLVDGIILVEGSDIANLTVNSGTSVDQAALTPSEGEIFYRTDIDQFQAYVNGSWIALGTTTDLSSHASNAALHLTLAQNTLLDGLSGTLTSVHLNHCEGLTSNAQTQLNARVPLAGGVMTGALTLSGYPTATMHAANKGYVDNGLSGKAATTHNHDADYLSLTDSTQIRTAANLHMQGVGQSSLRNNDGYGNFSVACGFESTDLGGLDNNNYAVTGSGAARLRFDFESVQGAIHMQVAPIGSAGATVSATDFVFTPDYLAMAGKRITNVSNPTSAQDAATKNYVDSAVAASGIQVAVLTGTISNGGTIPLPAGYSQAQCKWMVSFANTNSSTWWVGSGSYDGHRCYASASRVVTCHRWNSTDWYGGGNWVAEDANYIIIGVK